MEKEIVSIILQMLQANLLKELYDKRAVEYEFPPKLNADKLPFNVVQDFNKLHFDKYKDILIENACIYAIRNNNKVFMNFFTKNIDNLTEILDNEPMFKIKLSEYAIKNIINKHYDKTIDNTEIKNKYPNIFKLLKNNSIKIKSFTNMYRKLIIDFVKNYNHKSEPEYILDEFLKFNYWDEAFIKASNGIISSKNIEEYKKELIKLIFADVYVILESESKEVTQTDYEANLSKKAEEYKKILKEIYKISDEEFDDMYVIEDPRTDEDIADEIDNKMLKYIQECINNNSYSLPNNNKIRLNLFAAFITHNSFPIDRKMYIDALNEKKILSLKKINPYYKLDLIDNDNNID